MSKTLDQQNKNKKDPFKAPLPQLTAEQSIIWLDGMRELMLEVWAKNPDRIPKDRKVK